MILFTTHQVNIYFYYILKYAKEVQDGGYKRKKLHFLEIYVNV